MRIVILTVAEEGEAALAELLTKPGITQIGKGTIEAVHEGRADAANVLILDALPDLNLGDKDTLRHTSWQLISDVTRLSIKEAWRQVAEHQNKLFLRICEYMHRHDLRFADGSSPAPVVAGYLLGAARNLPEMQQYLAQDLRVRLFNRQVTCVELLLVLNKDDLLELYRFGQKLADQVIEGVQKFTEEHAP